MITENDQLQIKIINDIVYSKMTNNIVALPTRWFIENDNNIIGLPTIWLIAKWPKI